jgi:hypothetical protein
MKPSLALSLVPQGLVKQPTRGGESGKERPVFSAPATKALGAPFYARFRRRVGYHASPKSRYSLGPQRSRISYLAALATATYAAFRRERRMNIANATNFDSKSGGA